MSGTAGVPAEGLAHSWYHTIDLDEGRSTPGWFDTREAPRHVVWPGGLRSGRCLDVGTFDGFWAFEMERRGAAEVIAVDVDDPEGLDWSYDERTRGPEEILRWRSQRGVGFAEAAAAMGSTAKRVNRSVYDLDPAVDGMFDVVLCGALLLHLRDPVLALERMRGVCRGELLLVEALDPFLDVFARGVPAARFAPEWDQWWRVNCAGLWHLVDVSGFEVTWTGSRFLVPLGAGATANQQFGPLHNLAARQPRARGQLHVALRGRPRPARPRRQG